MYHMVLLIVNNLEQIPDILDAWEALEVPGITILESTGLGKLKETSYRDDIPLMPSISELFRSKEQRHRTLFTVVDSEEMVDRLILTSQRILGDLDQPRNGVLFVLPVSHVVGFSGAQERARK